MKKLIAILGIAASLAAPGTSAKTDASRCLGAKWHPAVPFARRASSCCHNRRLPSKEFC